MVAPNGYDDVTLAEGDVANSYEYMFDINTGTHASPVWLNVPQLTGFNPQSTPKNRDVTTYADQGQTNNKKTGADFTLDFNLLKIRDDTGEFQPEWLALKEAADAYGQDNNIEGRYYDSRGASDAYQGILAVGRGSRPSTANDEVGWDNFTFASVGRMTPIANPLNAAAPSVVSSVTPVSPAAATGSQITIHGTRFTGATAVHLGAINAPVFTVVDDSTIVVTVPSSTAGAVLVTVTTPAGTSTGFSYTRGA